MKGKRGVFKQANTHILAALHLVNIVNAMSIGGQEIDPCHIPKICTWTHKY